MTVKELAEAVYAMRQLQKLYFRKSPKASLADCKEAEREVDAALDAILSVEKLDLFNQAE